MGAPTKVILERAGAVDWPKVAERFAEAKARGKPLQVDPAEFADAVICARFIASIDINELCARLTLLRNEVSKRAKIAFLDEPIRSRFVSKTPLTERLCYDDLTTLLQHYPEDHEQIVKGLVDRRTSAWIGSMRRMGAPL